MKTVITTLNSKFIHSSLALRTLKAYCQEDYPDILLLEFSINDLYERIISEVVKQQPDLLCFSCYIWNIGQTMDIIDTIKKILPDCRILLGGPEVSYDGTELMVEYPFIDYIAVGEGEMTFHELLDCLYERGNFSQIHGLIWRDGANICFNGIRAPLIMDSVPFVYPKGFEELSNKIIYYETSRGCPFQCQYCLSSTTGKVRLLSLERVKQELAYFIHCGVPQVKLVDRTFNCDPARAREIFKFIIDMGGKTNFHFEMAGDLIDDEILDILSSAPVRLFQLEIGIQSTKDITLKAIKRKTDFNKISRAVTKIISGNNVHVHLDLIAGLPEEDIIAMAHSINEVFELRPHRLQLGFLKLLKGSGLRSSAQSYEYNFTSYPPYEVLSNNVISYKDLVSIKQIEELIEQYYNSHRFDKTINYMIGLYNKDAFHLFQDFSTYWLGKRYFNYSHSNIRLYEIIHQFGETLDIVNQVLFKELLLFDYIRHEKPNRYPKGLEPVRNELITDRIHSFLRDEDNIKKFVPYLEGYSAKQALRIIHIEVFQHHIDQKEEDTYTQGQTAILFDYQCPCGVAGEASIARVEI